MGNKLGRRRHVVDERYTKPQGLYVHKDVDIKKLRKLILESKLAPCYPGDEECCYDLEECPICFLCYPSLNRSRCCMKGICTECFLQMKNPNSTCPTQCPFCKTLNYAVEYRGVKTKEEKGLEQIEERVIEAKIRMRQQEIQEEEDTMQKRRELSSSSMTIAPGEAGYGSIGGHRPPVDREEIFASQEWCAGPMIRHPSHTRINRDDELDVDLEDIMVMEAIWLSIQVRKRIFNLEPAIEMVYNYGRQRALSYGDVTLSDQYVTTDRYVSPAMASTSQSSPSGDLACRIAGLSEQQQMCGESSISGNMSQFDFETSPDNRMTMSRNRGEWSVDCGSEIAEAGTSYASSDVTEDHTGVLAHEGIGGTFPLMLGLSSFGHSR